MRNRSTRTTRRQARGTSAWRRLAAVGRNTHKTTTTTYDLPAASAWRHLVAAWPTEQLPGGRAEGLQRLREAEEVRGEAVPRGDDENTQREGRVLRTMTRG